MAMDAEPIVIWGAGAIGGVLGAYWTRAGRDVLLVDIDAEHVAACRKGLVIEGPVEDFSVPVPAVIPDDVTGKYERIVLAVKAQATEVAMANLLRHLHDDGVVLSAQNGLNERTIAAIAGPSRCMGAFVNFGADWLAPGRILFGNRGAVVVGEIDGVTRERTHAMHDLLRLFEPDAVLTDDIWAYLWGKLGYGAMLFATALTPDSMTDNFADPTRRPVLAALACEVMAVAAAENVIPKGFNGFEPAAFAPDADPAAAAISLSALANFNSQTAKTHSGIWRDLAVRKRRTEVDPQIGIIVDIAKGHGIETPYLARLVALIHDIEEGRRDQSLATFQALAS